MTWRINDSLVPSAAAKKYWTHAPRNIDCFARRSWKWRAFIHSWIRALIHAFIHSFLALVVISYNQETTTATMRNFTCKIILAIAATTIASRQAQPMQWCCNDSPAHQRGLWKACHHLPAHQQGHQHACTTLWCTRAQNALLLIVIRCIFVTIILGKPNRRKWKIGNPTLGSGIIQKKDKFHRIVRQVAASF